MMIHATPESIALFLCRTDSCLETFDLVLFDVDEAFKPGAQRRRKKKGRGRRGQ